MNIKISKSDVLWSYIAQFFNIGSGFITLPFILHFLSTEEIAMNYLMMTIGTLVALIDFGFAPQFGRNFTYVFSGAQRLEKEGVPDKTIDVVNYRLLKCLIDVAKRVYMYMSICVLFLLATFGTLYINIVTNGFASVENSLLIWFIFAISTFFNIYFYYFSSLLIGKGLIEEEKKAMMASKVVYIILVIVLLVAGFGLIGVCIANLIAPFVNRYYAYKYFFSSDLKEKISHIETTKEEQKELFNVIFYNAKRLGLNFIGGYAVVKFSMFIAGIFLTLSEVSSYGLMMQLVTIIAGLSGTFFTSMFPHLTSLLVSDNKEQLIKEFSWTMNVFYLSYLILAIALVVIGPFALRIIGSNAELPVISILAAYLMVTFLEQNHGLFATLITASNKVPFVKPSLISGAIICIGDILVLKFTSMGMLGLVFVQGVVQLFYNNWYWPHYVCEDLNVSYLNILKIGFSESFIKIYNYEKKIL